MNRYSIYSIATGEKLGWITSSTRFSAAAEFARIETLAGCPLDIHTIVAK